MSIKVENLTKFYGSHLAVDNISFDIKSGEIVGFLGPNGAGKSTTLKMITTYLAPTSGKIFVDGMNILDKSIEVRKRMGYLPESNPLYYDMNVIDYLQYTAELQSIPSASIPKALDRMLDVCGLENVKHMDIQELSKGYKQRVGLAQAMIHDPDVLLLDEPTSGLDPNQIIEIRKLIKELGKKKTVMLSTHILQEVQAVCDRIIIINNGAIAANATPDELQRQTNTQFKLTVVVKSPEGKTTNDVSNEMSKIKNVTKVNVENNPSQNTWTINITSSTDKGFREDVFQKIVGMGLEMLEMKQSEATLEDIFRKLTN
jgi:ABC-2 type transport system ATP-binding protein